MNQFNLNQNYLLTKVFNMEANIQNAENVQRLMRYTYGLVPIVAGLDKFTNILTDWTHYLAPSISSALPLSASTFMAIVGIIEIIAGIIVLVRPRIGGYIVMAWLAAIALTLIVGGQYYDVAVRDLVMAIGAFSLARLSVPRVSMQYGGLTNPAAI
jgi:uncharacterized membrane protein YphA (DoxX/SURF4 family)